MASLFHQIQTSTNESVPSNGIPFNGNSRTLAFQGTFNATINVEASYDGGTTYIQLTDSDGTALNIQSDTIINISLGTGVLIRFVRSAGSGATNVKVFIA
jgi:hypothetical protein